MDLGSNRKDLGMDRVTASPNNLLVSWDTSSNANVEIAPRDEELHRNRVLCFDILTGDRETLLVLMNDDPALDCLQTCSVVVNYHFQKLAYLCSAVIEPVPQGLHFLSLAVVMEIYT